jgi:hypothetical protein
LLSICIVYIHVLSDSRVSVQLPQDLSKSTGLSRRQKEHSRRTVLVSVKRHALGMEAVDLYPSAVK